METILKEQDEMITPDYTGRRNRAAEQMEDWSVMILYSGIPTHVSADEYYPFEANRNFFYLTGLRRDHMILVITKKANEVKTSLFIEKADPHAERWTGKMTTADEAKRISGIENVRFLEEFEHGMNWLFSGSEIRNVYFDCFRGQREDMEDYNLQKAKEFAAAYPAIRLRDLWPIVTKLRMQKDREEEILLRKAVDITKNSLEHVMRQLRPGMKEYQVQAEFEYMIRYLGAEGTSFDTIAGSGHNGTMLHYETNQDTCKDGDLILLDLGAKYEGYCADITRTYPVSGRYSERQRSVYDIVLKANREVAAAAKPGMTLKELNDLCKKVLAEGCIKLGIIKEEKEIGKYYMHGVSHHLGIDVHDVALNGTKLVPGNVISDEPGLYIDEWGIGIRIEDDLMITEDGCVVLSEQIIRDPDEIEAFMGA